MPGGPGGGSKFCTDRCGLSDWVTVLDEGGAKVAATNMCGVPDCATCQANPCIGACGYPRSLDPQGAQSLWNGVQALDAGTCGAGLACASLRCAPAGHYVAHFCGHALDPADAGECAPADGCPCAAFNPTCVDVPFDYPANATVQGVLDPNN
jgi:hypothetical protein